MKLQITQKEILEKAYEQLAKDQNTKPQAFCRQQHTFTENIPQPGFRNYGLCNPSFFQLFVTSEAGVFSAGEEILPWLREEFSNVPARYLLTIPHLLAYQEKLQDYGHTLVDMHHYLLPLAEEIPATRESSFVWYEKEDLAQFCGHGEFTNNALAFSSTTPDVLAVGFPVDGKIVGLAGCSADGAELWQIGIDILPEYRGQGIAARLVRGLKEEVLRRGKIPFYGSVSSHVASQKTALRAGFYPAWVSLHSECIEK